MTVPPPHDAPQWGSGIPGIPSIWDAQPGTGPAPDPAPAWAPPPRQPGSGERTPAQRWGLVAVLLTALLLTGGLSLGGGEEQGIVVPEQYAMPEQEFWEEAFPPPPPPGPGGGAAPEPVLVEEGAGPGLVAARADGAGAPFGLPLGTTVVLRDEAVGSRLEVRPLSAAREGERLLVDVELRTPLGATAAVVPAVLLRLPDGRELRQTELRGGSEAESVPPVLGPGLTWRASFGFDAGPGEAVLVLHDGRTLAAWTVPAG